MWSPQDQRATSRLIQYSDTGPFRIPLTVSHPASAHTDVIVRLAAVRGRRISVAALDGYSECALEDGDGNVPTIAVVEPSVDQKGRNHC